MIKTIELSIGLNYVADWTIGDAIREILQNAIDQETRDISNKMTLDVTNNMITISNLTSKLSKDSLILGGTDKRNEDKTIGQFGEGYKLALLVLLRAGKEVLIHNHFEKEVWIPKIVKSKVFNTEVLALEIHKSWFKKPNNNLSFVIHDIEEPYSVLDSILLNRDKYRSIETDYGDILVDGESGNIYVNGLFVCHKKDLKYSYSIKPNHLKVGRDRDLVEDWDVMYKTSAMWQEVYPEYKDSLIYDVENEVADVKYIIYHQKTHFIGEISHNLGKDIYKEKYEGKVPVSSEVERDIAIKKYGPKVQTVIAPREVVELTKDSITVREIPIVPKEELLGNFYNRHKKQFTKIMLKEWDYIIDNIGL